METLNSDVKSAIESIISSKNFSTSPSIRVFPGSQSGDGFASKTAAITISASKETINLFVKYIPDNSSGEQIEFFKSIFDGELRFYEKVYPELLKFQQGKGAENIFNNVPRHYVTNIKWKGIPPIILDNIREAGYTLRDLKTPADENHISLVLKAYAKLHGTTFALRDQNPDLYKRISEGIVDTYAEKVRDSGFGAVTVDLFNEFIKNLNVDVDKTLIDKCTHFAESLMEFISSIPKFVDEYSAIGHSDCWSNNMMFLYDENTGDPIDVKLLDWQVHRIIPPALDAAHFFYGVARKEALNNFEYYRSLYYNTLSDHIRKLGSDPELLYPKEVFIDQWTRFSKFGLMIALSVYRVAYSNKDELVAIIDNKDGKMAMFPKDFKEKAEYNKIIKDLVEHLAHNGYF